MCGYCAERALLAGRVRALETRTAPQVDPLLLPVHLQEARDWRQAGIDARVQDDLVAALVMLCRAWSDRLLGVPGAPLHALLPPALQARLRDWLATLECPATWAWLDDDAAPLPEVLPVQAARDELDAYLGGWLRLGPHAEPGWDEARLHERLLRVSVALDLLLYAAPDDERITTLALSSPGATSPFSAIDLWLQRRAVRAFLARCSTHSVFPLLRQLRSDTVLAAVLHDDIDPAALRMMQATLQQGAAHATEGADDLRTVLALKLATPPTA
jgi:hypothetical protein